MRVCVVWPKTECNPHCRGPPCCLCVNWSTYGHPSIHSSLILLSHPLLPSLPPSCIVFFFFLPGVQCCSHRFDCQQRYWRWEGMNWCSAYPEVWLHGPDCYLYLLLEPDWPIWAALLPEEAVGGEGESLAAAEVWSGLVQGLDPHALIVNKETLQLATAAVTDDDFCWLFSSGNLFLEGDTQIEKPDLLSLATPEEVWCGFLQKAFSNKVLE